MNMSDKLQSSSVPKHPRLHWQEQDLIKILFCTIVVRVDSINRAGWTLGEFAQLHSLWGCTNGRLYWASEMMLPPPDLFHLIGAIMNPKGLVSKRDYYLFQEIHPDDFSHDDPEYRLLGPVPKARDIPWLDSRVDRHGTQWVWWKKGA